MSFRTIDESPLPVVLVGAGGFGRQWLAMLLAADKNMVELRGVADLDLEAARAAAPPGLPVGSDPVELARRTGAKALINVTVPAAHHPVTTAALFAGLPVLGEKPLAESVSQALSLRAAAELTGELFMVSQSRRRNPQLARLRALVDGLGRIGTVTTTFARSERFGGFRDRMAQPLLVDMAIHAFDAARYLLGADPVSVWCQSWNPPWSWFDGDANAVAVFEMTGGTRYVYNGTWCSPGEITSWNGAWRISGEHGTALWDGHDEPLLPGNAPDDPYGGIEASLHAFVEALRTGEPPSGEVHENLMSLAMVEAAVLSAERGFPVRLEDVLTAARDRAVTEEVRPDVRRRLMAG
ncbi:Gfo/Idh/MocA family oxidoreductase [Actinoplanes bogorensis]|uniref:Gfo/Idh/MocA family oxidoreductase n=1 Tax=Paractinoplanes bogorensis TaxID=1610840 RepID=A0ABS5YJP3_9ACTN|nr:Gfo/Idh/MocA family oxidoreductase [Actinoplanes bogorensis]MBU2663700.1 Gfo/Idh/MocA family oxidoreductase [Actinoplanes bogorensis]